MFGRIVNKSLPVRRLALGICLGWSRTPCARLDCVDGSARVYLSVQLAIKRHFENCSEWVRFQDILLGTVSPIGMQFVNSPLAY